jgi:hypothetical protein
MNTLQLFPLEINRLLGEFDPPMAHKPVESAHPVSDADFYELLLESSLPISNSYLSLDREKKNTGLLSVWLTPDL